MRWNRSVICQSDWMPVLLCGSRRPSHLLDGILMTAERAARQLYAPAHLRGRPFLVDLLQRDAPGIMYGVHQPDIFLEQCRCSHSVYCFVVTRNLPLRHRYTISLQNYKFHRTSPKKGETFVLWIKRTVAVIRLAIFGCKDTKISRQTSMSAGFL